MGAAKSMSYIETVKRRVVRCDSVPANFIESGANLCESYRQLTLVLWADIAATVTFITMPWEIQSNGFFVKGSQPLSHLWGPLKEYLKRGYKFHL